MKLRIVVTLIFVIAVATAPAMARNTFVKHSVKEAVTEGPLHENLLDVPFYMNGQKHPGAKKNFGSFKSNQTARAFGRSDKQACQVAFLSSLISLQNRALKEGADMIINIRSITKGKALDSSKNFLCVVGGILSRVGLEGDLVTIK